MSHQNQPLGTIIASILNYDQLCKVLGENPAANPAANPATSSYLPCDGRPMVGSALAKMIEKNNLPDLRGKFLRGLNVFYSVGEPSPFDPDTYGDPQRNRIAGDYQADAFQTHNHNYNMFNDGKIHDMSNDTDQRSASYGNNLQVTTSNAGNATETRPRNISVYYYIKIN